MVVHLLGQSDHNRFGEERTVTSNSIWRFALLNNYKKKLSINPNLSNSALLISV